MILGKEDNNKSQVGYIEVVTHDLIIHEMLRKKGQAIQHNRKTKQHNIARPRQLFFKEKLAASGRTRTHDRPLARRHSYQLSYRGSYSCTVHVFGRVKGGNMSLA